MISSPGSGSMAATATRLGQCIVMAVDYAHAHPEEAIVVYGSILLEGTRGQFSIDHAWCELRGGTVIYDGVQGAFYDASSYRRQLRATECFRWRPQDYDGPILSLRGEREC